MPFRSTATQSRSSARGYVRAASGNAWLPDLRSQVPAAAAPSSTQLPGIWGGAFSFKRGADHYFLLPDLQGHTRHMANAAGAVTHTFIYDAWGREIWPIVGTGVYLRPFGQWGYYRDTASRLYVRARHLRVELGKWVSRDPIGFEGGDMSAYRYVASVPVTRFDPTGQLELVSTHPELWRSGNKRDTCCGRFRALWNFEFLLRPGVGKRAPCAGWIVQKITITRKVSACDGTQLRDLFVNITYWEAWRFNFNKSVSVIRNAEGWPAEDTFTHYSAFPRTRGEAKWSGHLKFWCDPDHPNEPFGESGWSYTNCAPTNPQGTLLCRTSEPPSWQSPKLRVLEEFANHTANVDWCCCPEDDSADWSTVSVVNPVPKERSMPCLPW